MKPDTHAPNLGAFYTALIIGAMEKSTFTPEFAALRKELVAARMGAGLSQRELAKRLSVAHSWIAKVESGERRLDFVELCWILSACNVEPLAFFKRTIKSFAGIKRRRAEG
jgi:transcriptional regulator with XRE-family HTH domain